MLRENRSQPGADRAAGPRSSSSRKVIAVAVLGAALLRVAWAIRHGFALDQEGVEYCRIAQNLLAGRGYVGMLDNGTELNFAPLYPLMIAAVSLVVGSAALAARVIAIAFGSVLVIPMFGIAERLYGRRVAATVAALVVFHPVLIAGGASTYAEGPYLTLLMCGLLWWMDWTARPRVRAAAVAGAFLGLAYLVRPEAVVVVGVLAVAGFVAARLAFEGRPPLPGIVALAATFAAVAAPNIVFLTLSTGSLRIEAKGTVAYQWGQRIDSGMTYQEAAYAIGQDLNGRGVYMVPSLQVINAVHIDPARYLRYLMAAARRSHAEIELTITGEPALGSPILFVLVVVGLVGRSWDRRRLALEVTPGAAAVAMVLILLSVQQLWFRFFYALLGPLLLWAGKGADELGEWGSNTAASVASRAPVARAAGAALKWVAIGLVLVLSIRAVPDLAQFKDSLFANRVRAGRWLAQQPPRDKSVMDLGNQVAYYAGADLLYLPYATSDVALRYVAKRKPDYIVLMGAPKAYLPYTAQWFDVGIPDARARLVYDDSTSAEERLKIYRWAGDSSAMR